MPGKWGNPDNTTKNDKLSYDCLVFCFSFYFLKNKTKQKNICNQSDTSPETMIGFRIQSEYYDLSFLSRGLRLDLFGINSSPIVVNTGMTPVVVRWQQFVKTRLISYDQQQMIWFLELQGFSTPHFKRSETEHSSGSQWADKRRVVCHESSTVGAHGHHRQWSQ